MTIPELNMPFEFFFQNTTLFGFFTRASRSVSHHATSDAVRPNAQPQLENRLFLKPSTRRAPKPCSACSQVALPPLARRGQAVACDSSVASTWTPRRRRRQGVTPTLGAPPAPAGGPRPGVHRALFGVCLAHGSRSAAGTEVGTVMSYFLLYFFLPPGKFTLGFDVSGCSLINCLPPPPQLHMADPPAEHQRFTKRSGGSRGGWWAGASGPPTQPLCRPRSVCSSRKPKSF